MFANWLFSFYFQPDFMLSLYKYKADLCMWLYIIDEDRIPSSSSRSSRVATGYMARIGLYLVMEDV